MLTRDEIEKGYIDIVAERDLLKSHLVTVNALRKMQELIYESFDTLSEEDLLSALQAYLDGLLGPYVKRKPICVKKP